MQKEYFQAARRKRLAESIAKKLASQTGGLYFVNVRTNGDYHITRSVFGASATPPDSFLVAAIGLPSP